MIECCTCQDQLMRENLIHRFLTAIFFLTSQETNFSKQKDWLGDQGFFLGWKRFGYFWILYFWILYFLYFPVRSYIRKSNPPFLPSLLKGTSLLSMQCIACKLWGWDCLAGTSNKAYFHYSWNIYIKHSQMVLSSASPGHACDRLLRAPRADRWRFFTITRLLAGGIGF